MKNGHELLKAIEDELDGLIEIKERYFELDDPDLDDEIDEAIGRLLEQMSQYA